jgi:Protein of unknown function (DUF1194)
MLLAFNILRCLYISLPGKSTINLYQLAEVSLMTRFQVRRKLRKACSKAKYVAVETISLGQGNARLGNFRLGMDNTNLNSMPTCFQDKLRIGKLGAAVMSLGAASAVLALGVLSPAASFAATIVGTELVLSVDISGSVSNSEFNLQREGYVNAFRNPQIQNSIASIPGGIAATLSYWSRNAVQSVPWTHITNAEEADAIAAAPRSSFGSTGIANAIEFAQELIETNDFDGKKKVIDVSGDGAENVSSTTNLKAVRDKAVQAGIVINGLPIGGPSLESFFTDNVIGGPGSFIVAASNFSDFEDAVTKKIGREVTPDPDPVPEPLTILGSLAAGGVGAALRRKYKQQQKGTAEV